MTTVPLPDPHPDACVGTSVDGWTGAYTREQMRAYALQAVAAERERCAKLCEEVSREHFADGMTWECNGAAACASRIRRA
jgi:hypothetical protein